jgi:hypothetical protein
MPDSEHDGAWPNVTDTIQQLKSHNNQSLLFALSPIRRIDQAVQISLMRSGRQDIFGFRQDLVNRFMKVLGSIVSSFVARG